ncbi:hypothetical protein BASA81_014157 [Batrachochytrium salamandrivorans]|nr:hypothetical protein BASA81_014157 [Batrachochytrium salamandrivorans]
MDLNNTPPQTSLFKRPVRSASSKNSLRSKRQHLDRETNDDADVGVDSNRPTPHGLLPSSTSTSADQESVASTTVSSSLLLRQKKERMLSSSVLSASSPLVSSVRSWDTRAAVPATAASTSTAVSAAKLQHQQLLQRESLALETAYKSSGTAASLTKDTATRTLDVDGGEEEDRDPSTLAASTVILSGDDSERHSQIYQGQAAYTEYVNKKTDKVTQSNAGGIRAGPLRGSTNVRISSRFDYQPDICKDYKDTGYCGYGDSCKFMHDRGDYKAGWQIDRDWDEQQRTKQANLDPNRFLIASDDEGDDDDEGGKSKQDNEDDQEDLIDLPFACLICRGPFKFPINLLAKIELRKAKVAEREAKIKAANKDQEQEQDQDQDQEEEEDEDQGDL